MMMDGVAAVLSSPRQCSELDKEGTLSPQSHENDILDTSTCITTVTASDSLQDLLLENEDVFVQHNNLLWSRLYQFFTV